MMKRYILLLMFLVSAINFLLAQGRIQPYQKNDFRLDIKLPHVNFLSLNPNKEFRDSEVGFNGYGLGFEYNYTDRKFIEVNSSFVMTFGLPFPVHVDAEYNKILNSFYFNLTDNIICNRFTFGYGLNYSINSWKEWIRDFMQADLPTTSSKTITNNNIGITFNSYFRLGKTIHIGLIYNSSILNINSKAEFLYEHSISIEINWRIKLYNFNRNKS